MSKKLLFLILLAAFFLRFYKLGMVPSSLNWDENSNAYNAYSILKTGKDEYGNKFPLYNRSFDDFKPPLYMYLTIPSVAIFGLSPFAARLPSALLGFLTIITIFFLTKWLFQKNKHVEYFAVSSALLLTIAPWHIMFSRVGFEANIGLFVTTLALTLFLYGFEKKYFLIISAFFFGLSFYAYHAQRLFIPLILIGTCFLYRNELLKIQRKVIIGFLIVTLSMVLPLFFLVPKQAIIQRLNTTSSDFIKDNIRDSSLLILQDHQVGLSALGVLHNRRLEVARSYFENFLLNLHPNFLFIQGDGNIRHHLNNFGMLNIFFLPLIFSGVYLLAKGNLKLFFFTLLWLVLATVPASLATPSPHAIRSFLMIVPLIIFASIGLTSLFRSKNFFRIPLIIFTFFMILSSLRFIYDYFYHYPFYSAKDWQFGYSQAAKYTQELSGEFQKIYIDPGLEQAYIFWLFNLKIDPGEFQKASKNQFGNYYFEYPPQDSKDLFVSKAASFPKSHLVLKTINYPDSKEAIKIGYSK